MWVVSISGQCSSVVNDHQWSVASEAEDADVPRPDAADGDEAPRAERWSDDVDM